MTDQKAKLTADDLRQFTGTENYFKHPLASPYVYTDGVKHVADAGSAHWLLDKIATLQSVDAIGSEGFQVWRLQVADGAAVLTCVGADEKVLHREGISFTDFPLDHVKVWVEGNVILLPSEH